MTNTYLTPSGKKVSTSLWRHTKHTNGIGEFVEINIPNVGWVKGYKIRVQIKTNTVLVLTMADGTEDFKVPHPRETRMRYKMWKVQWDPNLVRRWIK